MKLLHPLALERSLFMAHDELRVVRELDVENLRLHSDRCVITVFNYDSVGKIIILLVGWCCISERRITGAL